MNPKLVPIVGVILRLPPQVTSFTDPTNEWYIFVANPDYEQCDAAIGEACGGVTIAHLNLQGSAARTLPGVDGSGYGHTVIKVGEYEVNWEITEA